MKILTAEQMRAMDQECIQSGTPASVLMENAGKAVAEESRTYLGELTSHHILCLTGTGNNGGDGLVATHYLHDWGARISVYLCSQRSEEDENLRLVKERNINCIEGNQDSSLTRFDALLKSVTVVIDAMLGTGKMRPLEGLYKQVLERVGNKKKEGNLKIIAIDLPSGMDANTGAVDPACPYADLTVTLAFPKLGHFNFPGAERVGTLKIVDIGIPSYLADSVNTELITKDWVRANLPKRRLDANKGTFGRVLVTAGSMNYIGAAYLACSGALRIGAGLVTLATAKSLQPVLATKLIEATYLPLPESQPGIIAAEAADSISSQKSHYSTFLIGCGLGQNPTTAEFLKAVISETDLPLLVLDADALNILAEIPEWWRLFRADAVLTPHPGEMARLCRLTVKEVQFDRLGIARRYAIEWNQTIVLKGAYTIIASPDGRCRVSPFANPGLASAGTGDVLAGCIAGLASQGLSSFDAATLGVYVHGEAGEMVKNALGDTGMLASDLLTILPVVIKQSREA